jgi:hypothetical protein
MQRSRYSRPDRNEHHQCQQERAPDLPAALWLSPGEMTGFWFRPDGDALYTDAFGSTDSPSKRQELLIEFLKVLKLIDEVVCL